MHTKFTQLKQAMGSLDMAEAGEEKTERGVGGDGGGQQAAGGGGRRRRASCHRQAVIHHTFAAVIWTHNSKVLEVGTSNSHHSNLAIMTTFLLYAFSDVACSLPFVIASSNFFIRSCFFRISHS